MRTKHITIAAIFSILLLGVFAGPAIARPHGTVGAVYVMSNAADGNEVLAFSRHNDGTLEHWQSYATGGNGTGAGLGNQGGLVMSNNHKWLIGVNAGSNEVFVFRIKKHDLSLTDNVDSGGLNPISVTIHGRLVYVLNAGGNVADVDSVTGFWLSPKGKLTALPYGPLPLSANSTGPAQIGFTPDGHLLVVTEKATNIIDTFIMYPGQAPDGPYMTTSEGMTPFGFSFGKRNQLFISEAHGGEAGAGTVSSYKVYPDGTLNVLDSAVPNHQTAPCWIIVSKDGHLAYTANTPDDSLSGFYIGFGGDLTLLDADGRTGEPGTGTNPLDIDFSGNERFLYTLNSGDGTVGAFEVYPDGSLGHLENMSGLPPGANGLAAR